MQILKKSEKWLLSTIRMIKINIIRNGLLCSAEKKHRYDLIFPFFSVFQFPQPMQIFKIAEKNDKSWNVVLKRIFWNNYYILKWIASLERQRVKWAFCFVIWIVKLMRTWKDNTNSKIRNFLRSFNYKRRIFVNS